MIDVACAIIVKGDHVLVTKRSSQMTQPNLWEFPGGKVEKNETSEKCIYREIKEELGVEINSPLALQPEIYSYSDKTIRLIPFVCSLKQNQSPFAHEHSELQWVENHKLVQLNWAPADIPILHQWFKKRDSLSFHMPTDIVSLVKIKFEMRRVRVIVEGKVQGVGFRYFVHDKAVRTGINGYVRNLPDGRVEIDAEGEIDQIRTFLEHCKEGPNHSKVLHFHIQDINTFGFDSFKIKH